jgi:ABC-type phosphate transport system permease subunit
MIVGLSSNGLNHLKSNQKYNIMKKFKISAGIFILYLMLIPCISSCSSDEYHETEQSKFIVKEILERKGMSKMTTYKVLMVDASGIGEKEFWIVDSIGKYDIGDMLWLQPYK